MAIEALQEKKTVAEIATEHDISPSMVTSWKKSFLNGEFSKELMKVRKELEEMTKMQQETYAQLGKKSLEVELLKKRLS